MELMSYPELSLDQGFITDEDFRSIKEKDGTTLKLIHGYIRYLKESKRGINEPGSLNRIADEHESYLVENDH